ncbi:hypothetical protein ABWL39_20285 [Chitinivorax sp. PXF-14]|uniref:hypothetical protein n=1 Tax=Chitinivorax sp. PXF-14 TaxID=3230488 RepID=UPI0034668CB5
MSLPITPEIVVEITFLSTEEGGRQGQILGGEYRGILGVGNEHFSVRFFVPLEGSTLGSVQRFGVQFLVPQAALPHFPVGASFSVWEGKVIGHGKVLEVLRNA